MRPLFVFAAACCLLHQSAAADIYLIPPEPVQVYLQPGERAISARADVYEALKPQRAYIQLAVLGKPVYVTPPPTHKGRLVYAGTEDPTPAPPLQAVTPVDENDIAAAMRIVTAAGIPPEDVTAVAPAGRTAPAGIVVEPLAIDDAGSANGAICGYRDREPLKELARAIEHNTYLVWTPNSRLGRFTRTLAVAWRLDGIPLNARGNGSPVFAPPLGYSNIDKAFATVGSSALATSAFDLDDPRMFGNEQQGALRRAAAAALTKAHGRMQAIIDQGIVKDWHGTMLQRVLVIYRPSTLQLEDHARQ